MNKTINKTVKAKSETQGKQFVEPTSDENKAINAYLNGDVGKFGNYFALPNALVHRTLAVDYKAVKSEVLESLIALDLNGHKIGNSSVLPHLGRTVSFGNARRNDSVTTVQETLSNLIPMVPFTVFLQAGLDMRKLNMLDRGEEETLTVRIENPEYSSYGTKAQQEAPKFLEVKRHFTGASLFEVENRVFLFDIDRNEIKHKLFNAFLAEIPMQVKTIADAYRALKPADVFIAEAQGLEVLRQGEWFLIPVKGEHEPDMELERWASEGKEPKMVNKRLTLQAGDNRPNTAEMGVEALGLVKGKFEHSGREHKTLVLKQWYKAVPNTATRSFTIVGDVD